MDSSYLLDNGYSLYMIESNSVRININNINTLTTFYQNSYLYDIHVIRDKKKLNTEPFYI